MNVFTYQMGKHKKDQEKCNRKGLLKVKLI